MQSAEIYSRFDSIRKQKGLSLYAVAKKAGCSSDALYKWRDRKTSPSLYLLESLAYALEIGLADLLYDSSFILSDETDKMLFRKISKLTNAEKATVFAYTVAIIENKYHDQSQIQ